MARSRRWLRWLGWTVVGLALLLVAAYGWVAMQGWADLRTPQVVAAADDPVQAARGRLFLRGAAERQGLAAWRAHRTQNLVAVDRWQRQGPWWPAPEQRFRSERLLGTFTSRVELLDGPGRGEIWGIQSWAPYKIPAAGGEPLWADDPAIRFYLPTLQYFDELPFRLLEAPLAIAAGSGEYRGRAHDRVFVTWGGSEPHAEHDQYDVWIDRDSGLISAVRYTVRDAVGFSGPVMRPLVRFLGAGTIHFEDYREVAGVLVPFVQTVTLAPPEKTPENLAESFFHRLELESAAFDVVDPAVLLPDPARPEPGDVKPAGY